MNAVEFGAELRTTAVEEEEGVEGRGTTTVDWLATVSPEVSGTPRRDTELGELVLGVSVSTAEDEGGVFDEENRGTNDS